MSSLFKIPFLISTQLALTATATAPSAASTPAERIKTVGMERVVPLYPYLLKALAWSPCTCEIIAILVTHFTPVEELITKHLNPKWFKSPAIQITPLFMLGWVVSIIGGFIRVRCYRVLGHHFTFDLSIRKHHKLITTGPYSYARHPSYTGGYLVWLGVLLTHLTDGSWVSECLGLHGHDRLKATLWAGLLLLCAIPIFKRMDKEDRMLESHFGNEWEQWCKRVPYRLIPWMY